MIRWLKRPIAWWNAPACPGAEILTNSDDRMRSLSAPAPVTDWDVAQRFEQVEPEPGRVEYRFLGVTGEEDV